MNTPSFRDVRLLSASLDDQLSPAERTHLQAILQRDASLEGVLADLRQVRSLLHRTPRRAVPRNFTLQPAMKRLRPPLPRLVPAFSWASAATMLVFLFTVGANLLGRLSFGAAAPMMAALPLSQESAGKGAQPETTSAPSDNALATPEPQMLLRSVPELPPPPAEPPAAKAQPPMINPWQFILLGAATVLILLALVIRQTTLKAFYRRVQKHRKE